MEPTVPKMVEKLRKAGSESAAKPSQDWLCRRPEETVRYILTLGLSKFDSAVARLLERIGSPAANPCARQLIELIIDLNWPVHLAALSALFSLDGSAVADAIQTLVWDECFREVEAFCYHALHEQPTWLAEVRPHIEEAVEAVREYATDSALVTLLRRLEEQ